MLCLFQGFEVNNTLPFSDLHSLLHSSNGFGTLRQDTACVMLLRTSYDWWKSPNQVLGRLKNDVHDGLVVGKPL